MNLVAAIRTSEWLVLRDVETGTECAYDLKRDPRELVPLSPQTSPAAAELAGRLGAFAARTAPKVDPPLDPELKKRLEALGYTDR